MSFHFMPLYTGDYLRDTRHLTPQKHGIYLLLLMHCWDQKGPLPLDEQECAGIANCRSSDEIESMRYIISRYFTKMDDGYYNLRMQNEIQKSEAISHKRSEAGRLGGVNRAAKMVRQANAKQMPSKCQANVATPTPTPIPIKEKIHTRFSALEYLLSMGVSDINARDYLAIRKAKRLQPTQRAFEKIAQEAKVAGLTFADAIEKCCEHGWAGFQASWLHADQSKESWKSEIK